MSDLIWFISDRILRIDFRHKYDPGHNNHHQRACVKFLLQGYSSGKCWNGNFKLTLKTKIFNQWKLQEFKSLVIMVCNSKAIHHHFILPALHVGMGRMVWQDSTHRRTSSSNVSFLAWFLWLNSFWHHPLYRVVFFCGTSIIKVVLPSTRTMWPFSMVLLLLSAWYYCYSDQLSTT